MRIDPKLYAEVKIEAAIEHRTISAQLEYWAKVGRTAIDNPELPISFIVDLLAALDEPESYKTPFVFREVPAEFQKTL